MKNFLLSIIIYGGGIITLGFLAGHPIIGILFALFVVLSLYMATLVGMVHGAETALRNPPPQGETRVTLKFMNQEIKMSDDFIFSPPAPDGKVNSFVLIPRNKGGRPKGSTQYPQDEKAFQMIQADNISMREVWRIIHHEYYDDPNNKYPVNYWENLDNIQREREYDNFRKRMENRFNDLDNNLQ